MVCSKLVSLPICVIFSEGIFATELCCLQQISFAAKGVVYNELVSLLIWSVCNELVPLPICVACSEPVLLSNYVLCGELISLPNCVVCSELVSLPICVICSEGIYAAEWCCLQRISFRCRIMWSAANQCSLPKLRCLQWLSIRCRNRVVCSESAFAAESVLSALNLWFTTETELSAANQCSLSKLNCLQRISIHCWKCVGCNESAFAIENVLSAVNLWFATETELSATNLCSLPKVCVLQWICDSLSKLNLLQWISIHYQKCVAYSKSAFAAKVVLSVTNQRLLSKLCCLQRKCDSPLKSSCLQRISIRSKNVLAATK